MKKKEIKKSSYKQMPWKNGDGQTSEIARFPQEQDPYIWRLSQADILKDGPFSRFSLYQRWICIFKGEGIILENHKLEVQRPFLFSGSDPAHCKLINGPVSDLGLIFDPVRLNADMKIVEGNIDLFQDTLYFFYNLKSGDTLQVEEATTIEVTKSIMVSLTPR